MWRRLRSEGPSRLAWCWFVVALFASLGANVATAGFLDLTDPPAPLRLGIAGWPALAFLGGTLLAHSSTTEPEPVPPAPVADPSDAEQPVPEAVSAPDAAPAPEATASAAPVPSVPAVLVDHARKVADECRARTGSPIDPDTLRSRLGVPPRRPAPPRRRHRRPTRLTRRETPAMPARDNFHSVMRIGPVQIGTHRDRNGRTMHAAVCTADRCGWSADYSSQTAAQLAARTHRCTVR
ncbi:mobile element transfer protein [Streptomyces mirabilis]|uniref:mobile element transfer protein n=1 Tax=Streptomyces mirabilis TaxID=68239 RepID=UPI0036F33A32